MTTADSAQAKSKNSFPPFAALFSAGLVGSGIILDMAHGAGWPTLSTAAGLLLGAASIVGWHDIVQKRHAVLRNYPVIGHFRYLLEAIRPEIRQYFIENDNEEVPFSRAQRALVYQRSKGAEDKRPFGTMENVYAAGYGWVTHSMVPVHPEIQDPRVRIGGPDCKQPYDASLYNISAMSFGALSANAIASLNRGAKLGGFCHDTGEGSISKYHRQGGDLVWQIASGYFGCRDEAGNFDPEKFRQQAADPQIKMIEVKLSQGAKPGHGGMLPAAKISEEIAETRGIPMGKDCVSPPSHAALDTPLKVIEFIAKLRELSDGKPVGIKLCIGHRREFMSLVKAMLELKVYPDFIIVDGKEGGTGAAPVEFANRVGMPMMDGLHFVHNTLRGAGIRSHIAIGAAGKIVSAFDIARALALGADFCNAARGFMFALGCIQAQACHTNKCPVGIATQDQRRQQAINVPDKAERVARFHKNTIKALVELAGSAGLHDPREFMPYHMMFRQVNGGFEDGNELYPYLPEGFLLTDETPTGLESWKSRWDRASSSTFHPKSIPTWKMS